MKLSSYSGFTSDLWNHGASYAVRHAAEQGFSAVEFIDYPSDRPLLYQTFNTGEINAALAEHGMTVSCYSLGVRLQKGEPQETLEHVYKNIEFAAKIHAPYFHHTITMDYSPKEGDPSYKEMLNKIFPLAVAIAKKCAEHGITCLYEPQGVYFNGVRGLNKFFKKIKKQCPNVGICGDFGNSYFVDVPTVKVIRKFARYIKHVHVKDYLYNVDLPDQEGYKSYRGRNIYDCEIGAGVVDFARCFAYLRRAGYDGAISFEINADDAAMQKAIAYVVAAAEKH